MSSARIYALCYLTLPIVVSGIPDSKKSTIYGGSGVHPPTLTPTERLHVIRVCYQTWSMWWSYNALYVEARSYKSYAARVRAEISSLRPRELLYFANIARFARRRDFIGDLSYRKFVSMRAARVAQLYSDTYGCKEPNFRHRIARHDLSFLWDHCQNNLKNFICRRPTSDSSWDEHAVSLEHLWDYEEGDELFIADE